METITENWQIKKLEIIQLYSLNTPNGIKVACLLEELDLEYEAHTVNIGAGEQFSDYYKTLSPNSKIPTLIDPNGPGGEKIIMMESGAILLYLAQKESRFIPSDPIEYNQCLQWLFFQVGHVGPMFGQFGHFFRFAKEKCSDPYPLKRYQDESIRLLSVLDERLSGREFIMGESYTIADMAIWPWVDSMDQFYKAGEELNLGSFENVVRWCNSCLSRKASATAKSVCALN